MSAKPAEHERSRDAARLLLTRTYMQDASDFSLRIVVMSPERAVDELAPTRPFARTHLPEPSQPPTRLAPTARHAVPSRQKVQRRAALPPPPPTRATPLSDEDEARVLRRRRMYERMLWARNLLQRFNFQSAV